MSVGRFTSAIVAGMLAGGVTAMSGVGREATVDAVPVAVVGQAAAPVAAGAKPVLTMVDPRR